MERNAEAHTPTSSPIEIGFLLDVDGPIASPVTRSIAIPSIVDDLVALTAAGVPIAFITGRSDAFIAEQVIAPLWDAGLGDALGQPGARMFGVFEKGGAWARVDSDGMSDTVIDESVAFSAEAIAGIRELVAARFSDTMFFDETKRAMISVEQRTDVSSDAYRARQDDFQAAAFDLLAGLGVGLSYGEQSHVDAKGATPFRIDPTIISTDIESVLLDKDRGAERAIEYFARLGHLPREWRSVGDSRSDYKMADYVHAAGMNVAHVDVRPADGVLEREYQVLTFDDYIHDEAGALLLSYWRRAIGA
ncbi:hypothetical protein [Microbacterium sp. NC79]|uniref:hypothetical protein n=1 Tax=Microbacterium sp. NC79 TaxID=2851009 RepID=UPI001C2C3486|nr:hypothetical protein [Microbacterium sp. NC79]MBV0896068.1 hypothetical protein [Microbacterium sp. NC79]